MDVEDALEAQRKAHPDMVEKLDNIHKLATAKLFHQLTQALLEYLGQPLFDSAGVAAELLGFFNGYIKSFLDKFGKIFSLRILTIVMKHQTPEASLELLAPFEASCKDERDPKLFCSVLKAEKLILKGDYDAAKDDLENLDKAITEAYEVDAVIQGQFHKTYALLWKKLERPQEFFRSSLLYLAFTPVAAISLEERPRVAFEIGVAGMLAEEEYIFGELLEQELLASLDGTQYAWVKDILKAFGEGRFDMYDEALKKHKAQIDATPELAGKEATVLRPKMAALALMELVFRKPKKQRRVTFEELATHCRVEVKQVESLVMRAMCAQLIKGKIDEVNSTVVITWVKPRILDKERVKVMADRMSTWAQQTDLLTKHLEDMTPELLLS